MSVSWMTIANLPRFVLSNTNNRFSKKMQKFQNLVQQAFDQKIIAMQTD
jgi:hypothetical protein